MVSVARDNGRHFCKMGDSYAEVHLQGNSNAELGLVRATIKWFGSSEAIFRLGQLMDRLPRWVNTGREAYGYKPFSSLQTLSSKGMTAWTWGTTFPRIPEVIIQAMDSHRAAAEGAADGSSPDQVAAKSVEAARDVMEAVTMICHGVTMPLSIFFPGATVGKVLATTADNTTLAHDTIDLGVVAANLNRAYQVDCHGATEEVLVALDQTKTNNMIAIAKSVCSVFSGLLGLILLTTGIAPISGFGLVTLSLSSTLLAITRKLHELQMTYKPIDFFAANHISWVSA